MHTPSLVPQNERRFGLPCSSWVFFLLYCSCCFVFVASVLIAHRRACVCVCVYTLPPLSIFPESGALLRQWCSHLPQFQCVRIFGTGAIEIWTFYPLGLETCTSSWSMSSSHL